MKWTDRQRKTCLFLALCLLAAPVSAQNIVDTVSSLGNIIYGVAAGIAILMLAYGAIRMKTTDDPGEREAAKRAVFSVLMGLALIVIASSAVNMAYKKNPDADVSVTVARITTTTTSTTTTKRTTTTLDTTTTTSSTTSTTRDTFLTAANLAYCINSKKGFLVTNPSGCPACSAQKGVFDRVPDGPAAYASLKKYEPPYVGLPTCTGCSSLPGWCTPAGKAAACTCNTFEQLNSAYGCGLVCKPGYVYYTCGGSGSTKC